MSEPDIPQVVAIEPGSGENIALPGFGALIKLYGSDNDGELGLVVHPFAVGTIVAPHRHTREDEHSVVLEGRIGFRSDDTEVVLEPGGIITKPRGQTHAMWNAGAVPGRILEIITPGGFETYFRELGRLLDAASGPAPGRSTAARHESHAFSDLAARYGISYENPPWLDDVILRYGLDPPSH